MEVPCLICLKRFKLHLTLVLLGVLVIPVPVGAAPDETGSGLIPELIVSMKDSDQPSYALVVEKSSQVITLFKYDGRYQVVETMQSSTGKARGEKKVNGDQKTPEGVYFFTKEFEDRDLAPLYGTRAFSLDYPNFMDRRQGRNGYGIWMHGTNRPLKDRDSNGCIALENEDIDKLAAYIALKDTPILIAEKVTYKPVAKAALEEKKIRSFLSRWNNALAKGSYHFYLAYYDPEYLPAISWWMKWMAIRKPGPHAAGPVDTGLRYTGIYKHGEIYVVLFDQELSVGTLKMDAGRRKIFISLKSGNPRIVGDTFMETGTGNNSDAAGYPLLVAAQALRSRHSGETAIADLVERWVKAWSEKDIEIYGACYAEDFRSQKMDKRMWVAYKKRLNKIYSNIKVSVDNIDISRGEDIATVTFFQTYESSAHKTRGVKRLILKMEERKWKIFRETFKKN
jgi:murein L,D-transpeptidase YafK